MKKVIPAIILSIGLASCGATTVVKEVPQSTSAPVVTQSVNKYEKYLEFVKANAGQAYSYSDGQLIETGDLVCSALDAGKSMAQISNLMENTAQTQSDIKLFAAVMYGAIQNICPEYLADLRAHLNSGY